MFTRPIPDASGRRHGRPARECRYIFLKAVGPENIIGMVFRPELFNNKVFGPSGKILFLGRYWIDADGLMFECLHHEVYGLKDLV